MGSGEVLMMIRPPLSIPRPRLPATGTGGRGWGEFLTVRITAAEYRRGPSGSGVAGPAPSSALCPSRRPGAPFFRRGRAQVVRGEIVMIDALVPPTLRLTTATPRDRGGGCRGREGGPWPGVITAPPTSIAEAPSGSGAGPALWIRPTQ